MYRKIITALVLLVTLLAIVACETETGIAKDILERSPTTEFLLPNWYRNMNVARMMPMTSTKKR